MEPAQELTKPAQERLTASHVKAVLRMQYAAPKYAVLEEVRNATGMLKRRHGVQPRYADMVAIGLYPSEGLEMIGFEVKVTRADWLSEISDKKKAVAVSKFCDRWYLVTPNEKIVKDGELPDGWGWLTVERTSNGYRLKEMVAAPKLDAAPITREFLASLMRNATTSNPDYIDVQSKIIQDVAAANPDRKRSDVKAMKRFSTTIKGAAKRRSSQKESLAQMMMRG
jgi:hypothetical protein